ncbi:MAG TPA: Do family serine endopeptidase [Allosphingosinicella sp.]|nr:Do family serine endopeptidase [Allosphingosinicella sp.]
MRYIYGLTAALLIGGAAATLTVGPVGAQTAQNEPGSIAAATPRAGAPMSFADLSARLQPAVVNISTKQSVQVSQNRQLPPGFEEFFRRFGAPVPDSNEPPATQRGGSLGSGFVISADGFIVTNNHVVSPSRTGATVDQITVTFADRREFEAELVGRDPASDLAVLKIKGNNFPFVRFAQGEQVRVGDWVVAIGNPFGLGGTVTAGIVSALHRNIGAGIYDRYIQTDASINMGNSGGPMFDLNGNVVGINTALISPTGGNVGIGFAIPADQAQPIVEALRRGQRPQRGYIGVSLQNITEDIAGSLGLEKNRGELIRDVTPGAGAARAGIQQGDVVITVNNQPVTPDQSLAYLVSNVRPGTRVPVELIRNGARRTVTVTVGERPSEEELARLNGIEEERPMAEPRENEQSTSQRSARESLGVTVQALTPEIARSLRITDPNVRGLVVSGVNPSSDAGQKLQQGDIILSINQRVTRTPEEAAAAVAAARAANRNTVLLLVKRGNTPPVYVGVELVRR